MICLDDVCRIGDHSEAISEVLIEYCIKVAHPDPDLTSEEDREAFKGAASLKSKIVKLSHMLDEADPELQLTSILREIPSVNKEIFE